MHYLDLPSAKPLNSLGFLFSCSTLPSMIFSSSFIFDKISKASNIASFLVAAAFFNLSAEISGPKSIIGSLATLINSLTATCPAWIIFFFVSFVLIFYNYII